MQGSFAERNHIMNSGYYAACAGLSARMRSLEVVANNLANLNTSGYRAQETNFRSLLAGAVAGVSNPLNRAINDFGVMDGTRLDLNAGNLANTGNPLDLGLEGKGFFAVQRPAGVFYTRSGSFQISRSGQLVTAEGDPVLGQQGPIAVPSGALAISSDGTLSVDGAVAGQLRLVDVAPGTALLAAGHSYYSAAAGTKPMPAPAAVRQGMLESSNVSAVQSTVGLIAVQRQAEMLERALSSFDNDFNRIAATDLSRV